MKNVTSKFLIPLAWAALLASCSINTSTSTSASGGTTSSTSSSTSKTTPSSGTTSSSSSSVSFSTDTVQGDFSITTEDGAYSEDNGIYTITAAGSYELVGKLAGQIVVNAGDEDAVELTLNGASITYGENSPIYVVNADEVKIKAKKETVNFVTDTREEQTEDDDTQGGGAIYADADLKFGGQGTLTVTGGYNNGIHTTKDLKIQKLTLNVAAPNNAIKGNDSVNVETGNVTAVSYAGDAIKSSSTDLSSSSKQRGDVNIYGGTLNLYAGCDGIDVAYNLNIYNAADEDDPSVTNVPTINIWTNKYSSYSSSSVLAAYTNLEYAPGGGGPGGNPGGNPGGGMPGGSQTADKAEDSAKGLKAANGIYISGGVTSIYAYDDGVHANSGDTFESGAKGIGAIAVSGGTLNVTCSDDGLHADGTLAISGGNINVLESHEGLEGNVITVSGGESVIYGQDDAVNASTSIKVTGGYLFACVPSNGDTDGIDSNGSYEQTGGTVITCGPNSETAAAVDTDGAVKISGGTLVVFGMLARNPTTYSGVTTSSLSGTYGSKAYTVTFESGSVQTGKLLSYNYSSCRCYSVLGKVSSCA